MPSDRAVALLEPLTHERVSVAKEAVRLLGDLRSEASYRALVHLHRSNLHRGVRVALLRALWAFPQHEATWEIFAASAVSPDRALPAVVGRIPAERLSPEAYRRLVDVLATLARHPDPLVRQAALERCAERPVSDPERRLLAAMLDALHSPLPDERAVASAAVVTTYGPRDPALLGETVREYRADRRMLEALAQGFQSAQARLTVSSRRGQIPRRALRRMREHGVGGTWLTMHRIAQGARADLLAPAARAVIDALADDLLTAGYRARLALGTLPFGEAAQILEALAAAGGLYPAALEQAVDSVEMAAHRREDADPLWLEERLRGSLDPRLRRIALAALIASTVAPRGWDEPKLALLRAYRTDPDPSVAAVAEFTLPPQENA